MLHATKRTVRWSCVVVSLCEEARTRLVDHAFDQSASVWTRLFVVYHTVSQLESELQLSNAQVTSNKTSMGTLADLVLEKTSELEQHVTSQLQRLQVESNQRLTDMQLTLERLEFRFKHHVRDCQTVVEQIDLHQESLQTLRSQLAQTQNLLDTQREEQTAFAAAMQYTASTTESKTTVAVDECVKKLESFQQRMVAYVKQVEAGVQGDACTTVRLRLECAEAATDVRYVSRQSQCSSSQCRFATWRSATSAKER